MVHIRTDREISLISASLEIVADTLNMLSEHVRPGIKIIDLDQMAEEFILSKGARPAFKGIWVFPQLYAYLLTMRWFMVSPATNF